MKYYVPYLVIGLSPFLTHCNQEAQVGSTGETKLMAEYEAATKEYDNTRPTVLDPTLTGSVASETSISLTWNKASDNSGGSDSSALSYRVYMSTQANINTADEIIANGSPLTEWTADQSTIEITIPTLKKLNNLYVNILVQDEKSNQTGYTILSLKNDSPFGELKLAGTKDGADFSEILTAHSSDSSLVYDTYLMQTANSAYSISVTNSDATLTWNFDDLTLDTANVIAATKATDGKISLNLSGGTGAATKVYRVGMDATDKTNPKLLVTQNAPYIEVEFELRLKDSKISSYSNMGALRTDLFNVLYTANSTATAAFTAVAHTKYQINKELFQEDLSNCTLKKNNYALKQKFSFAEATANNATTLPPTFAAASATSSSLAWSVSLKSRSADRNLAYLNNTTTNQTPDKNDEFTKAVAPNSTVFERNSTFLSYSPSAGCGTTTPCAFTTIGDLLQKYPNTNLSASSSATLSDLTGGADLYDVELYIIKAPTAPVYSDIALKKASIDLVYAKSGSNAAQLIYSRMTVKISNSGATATEASTNYANALAKIQSTVNSWAALTDWFEPTDNQIDKNSFLYQYYNRCQ